MDEKPHIRWMIRRDHPEVLEIERLCFEFPWTGEDLLRCLRQSNCIGQVAEFNERVVGFIVYELHYAHLHVLNFAVHPAFRRRGIGRLLIEHKIESLREHERRNRILLEVRETNLDAQLFFRAVGFRAISVLRDFYDDTTEDAFLFQYRVQQEAMA